MASRRMIALVAVLAGLLAGGQAGAFDLITLDEHRASLAAERDEPAPAGRPRSLTPSTPRIEIASPDAAAAVRPPVTIEIRFRADPPAVVEPSTFRVLYGFLRLDITERIRKAAKITVDGLRAEGAALPSGSHRLLIGIGDSLGRFAEREVRFSVE